MGKFFISLLLAALAFLWMYTGEITKPAAQIAASLEEQQKKQRAASRDVVTRVRTRVISASAQTGAVIVRGRTEANRVVDVRAETSGRVIRLPRSRGDRLAKGDVICEIDQENRTAKLEEAKAKTKQARLEHDGALSLRADGLQSEANMAASTANLAAEHANLNQRKLDLDRTKIRAPFAGILDDILVEIGHYLQLGDSCGRLVDLNPILVVGHIAERDVNIVKTNSSAVATLLDGSQLQGVVRFVSRHADSLSRTYEIEVEIPNPEIVIPSGLTATLSIATETYLAHEIPPSLLTLDDEGNIGVRTLDGNNQVVFQPVDLIKDTPNGIWVAGLSPITTLITSGHELVVEGDYVKVDLESDGAKADLRRDRPTEASDRATRRRGS